MNPNVNPYSSGANMFVGGPAQQEQGSEAPAPAPAAASPAGDDLFSEMNVFEDPFQQGGGSTAKEDPFKAQGAQENPFQQEEEIQFYNPSGSSGAKENVAFTPEGMEEESVSPRVEVRVESTAPAQVPEQELTHEAEEETAPREKVQRTAKCWTLGFYQQYFDVDTEEVTGRCREVLTFKKPRFMMSDCEGGEPADMYGPVWVATTLWVALAVFGEIGGELDSSSSPAANTTSDQSSDDGSSKSFSFNFYYFVIIGMTVAYAYVVLTPLLAWGLLKINDIKIDLTKIISLYGYSMIPLLFGSLITIVPNKSVKWGAIFLTSAVSFTIIMFNMYGFGSSLTYNWKLAYYGSISVCHVAMSILLFYEILFLD